MRKLILLSIASLLCTIFQSNAQSGVFCTLEDANGEVITMDLMVSNEVPFIFGLCAYDVNLTMSAVDGMANQAVQVEMQAGSFYTAIHTLPSGQSSVSPINNITLLFPCGFITTVQFTVVGNPISSCLDQAFFPVEFTRFEANNAKDGKVQLIWETASEIDNEGFGIERSQDGYKWETLDFIKGAGTILEKQYYEWTDDTPFSQQVNYYRLKQIDFGGDTEYSEIVAVKVVNKGKITLFPNPVTDFVTLNLGDEKNIDQIELYNAQGRLMYSVPLQYGIYQQTLNTQDLMVGVYWVVLTSKNARTQIKLIKQ